MELIKPPISARDVYYKAGAILSFSSLRWIQLGPRESAWEAPEASHPKPPPGPSQPLQHGNTTGDGHDAQRCSPNTLKALEHRQGHVTLSSFFSRRFLLLLDALTKISGRYEETRQLLSFPLPQLDPPGTSKAVASAFLEWRSKESSHVPHNSLR